jgi:hypothetical protein
MLMWLMNLGFGASGVTVTALNPTRTFRAKPVTVVFRAKLQRVIFIA